MQEIVDWCNIPNSQKLGDKREEGHTGNYLLAWNAPLALALGYSTYAYIGVLVLPVRQDSRSQMLYIGPRSWRKEKSCHQPIASRGR